MTWAWFQRGAHMALRMPWKRMESPAPKRGSTIASEVRMETRSLVTRSAIVFEIEILPSVAEFELRCFTTIGMSLSEPSSLSIRNPRSAGMCSKTMSMTCWRTSSTGRTAMSVSATLVRTFRIRFAFSTSWTSARAPFFSARPAASRWPGVGEELAQLADAADDRARLFREGLGLVEHDLAFERLAEGELELAEQDPVAVLEGRFDHGHAVDLRAVLGLEVLDPHARPRRRRAWRGCARCRSPSGRSGSRASGRS